MQETWPQSHQTMSHNWPPDQCGGNVTMCAAVSENGVSTHIPHTGSCNTQLLLVFLGRLYRDLTPEHERYLVRQDSTKDVIVWGNVSFHRATAVGEWFAAHQRMKKGVHSVILPEPNRGVPLSLMVESTWPSATGSDVSVVNAEGDHRWSVQGMDEPRKKQKTKNKKQTPPHKNIIRPIQVRMRSSSEPSFFFSCRLLSKNTLRGFETSPPKRWKNHSRSIPF